MAALNADWKDEQDKNNCESYFKRFIDNSKIQNQNS